MRIPVYIQIIALVVISSCTNYKSQREICEVEEYFITVRRPDLNVDSVALWHGPRGEHWLIATAKSGHVLVVYDAVTGEYIKEIGKPGQALGQLRRPNGIAIVDDLVFIIERDNKRMHIFSLPEGIALGMTHGTMQRPYGIDVMRDKPGEYIAYVTDNYNEAEQFGPKDVHVYHIDHKDGKIAISLMKTFGDREGAGVLHKVESIAIDKNHDRLIIADEYEKQKNLKIYTLDGIFTGQILGSGLIEYEPEGICVYATGPKTGYIIVTDQDRIGNKFYVFDRQTLAQVGAFKGKIVRNTDGVTVTNRSFGPFKSGAFYAVHDDGNICAYDWHTIAHMCGLNENERAG